MSANLMTVSETMLDALRKTKPWVTFLAVLGFIFCGLIALLAILMFTVGGTVNHFPHQPGTPSIFGPAFAAGFGILYLVMAVFMYLLPCLLLIRYSTAIGRIAQTGQTAMEEALLKQKSFWKYVGILAIVMLALYVVIIIGAVVVAVTVGMHAAH